MRKKVSLVLIVFLLLTFLLAQNKRVFAQFPTPTFYNPVVTSTPNPDGSIIHVVKEGESLWLIAMAYGVTMQEIQINTGNSPEAVDVYERQVLVIRKAFTPTPTSDFTVTPTRITPQPTVPRPTRTPVPSKTPAPTFTPTATPRPFDVIMGNSKHVGLTMAGISFVGLVLVLIFGFLKRQK